MLLRLIGAFFRLLVWPLLAWRRARAIPRGALVHVVIDGAVTDIATEPRWWNAWRPRPTSLHGVARVIDEVLRDARVRGMLVTVRDLRCGMATATSLRDLLRRVRDAGRELAIELPLGGTSKELYVASIGTRVIAGPQTLLAPIGFASATRYVRRTLDRVGVEPEVFARGKYKSAGETIVRDAMSEPQREQLEALLDVFYTQLVGAIAEGRGVGIERARAIVDGAPYLDEEARAAGLVDAIAYEDEVAGLLGVDGERARIVDAGRFMRVVRAPRFKPIRRRPQIGVVRVHGAIAGHTSMAQGLATDDRVIAAVRKARRDPRVRAVVLHVDSPGGSALASDRIHHELEQLAKEKPLVACMANVAASGGYYVSAAAHAIVAQPTTITGSIGVVSARAVVEPLLERLGVRTEIVKRGARADLLEPTRRLSEDERAAIRREIEGMYQAFLGVVARGRKRGRDEIEALAQGRVWSGADAARVGLVDALGGFEEALARARALVGPGAERFEPAIVRGGRTPLPPLDPPSPKRAAVAALIDAGGEVGIDLVPLAFARDRVLAWCGVPIDLR